MVNSTRCETIPKKISSVDQMSIAESYRKSQFEKDAIKILKKKGLIFEYTKGWFRKI
jgi:hypothetical protein